MMKRLAVILFFLFFPVMAANAQSADVRASVSASETTVGQPVEFSVSVSSAHRSISFDLPEMKKYSAVDLKVQPSAKQPDEDEKLPLYSVEAVDVADLSTNDAFRKTVKIRVLYCAPGDYKIPPFAVKDDGRIVPFESPRVTVKAVNTDGQTAEIEPPFALKGNHTRIVILVLAVFLLGAACFALWRRLRGRKRPAADVKARPEIEAFRESAEAVRASLEAGSLPPDRFALELSMSFRRLICAVYGFDAAEMTSSEILASIVSRRKGLTVERYGSSLEGIMNLWDMTKFAEFAPSNDTLKINLSETVALAERMWRDSGGI